MDERYQVSKNNSRNYARIVQKSTDSGYNYNNFGRSLEPVRNGTNLRTELYSTNKTSLYGQEQRPQLGYASDLKRRQYRSRSGEYPSYTCGEPERNYSSRHDIELQVDPGRRPKRNRHQKHGQECYKRKKYGRCWRKFRRLLGSRKKHHRKHRHRSWEQVFTGEGYPAMQKAISAGSISPALLPAETKVMSIPTPQPSPDNWLSGLDQRKKKTEERTEEKEKSNEKATKSTSVEQMPQKVPETILKAKKMEESAATKCEQTDEDEQKIRQRRKITQFIEQIAKDGMEGIKNEFINCRSFIPKAITRSAHDRNLIKCRYSDIVCIDQTRIVLRCDAGDSDFIHASRVPLGDNPNEIIITQLPLSNTVRHFWEMVWQENVQAVLLFLTLSEWKQHAENIQLIPEKGKCLHLEDFMMLTDKNEFNVTSDWIVREYYLSRGDETRRILWHHYSAWEPNKSPRDCEHFWPLHSSLRKVRRPYVCMSLAGAGRAGCYAALEWAHLMLHDRNASVINIAECVRKVRSYRMHAVQTTAQFQFLYMGIQRHIFLVEKIRKEILSDQATFEATKKCSLIEYKFYRSDGYPTDDDFDL